MESKKTYDIAVVFGDGVGPEVCGATVEVLKAAVANSKALNFIEYPGGVATYRETGTALPEKTMEGCKSADAILHGAAGLPNATYADGTEIGMDFGLVLRYELDLYANLRYSKLFKGTTSHLRYAEPGDIDFVVLRENVEGLYASKGRGMLLRDEVATDSLMITRKGTERVARMAFELSRKRNGAPADGKRRVTVCDKANVLRSYAFFRKVCTEVAKDYPDVELEHMLVDACSMRLIQRPAQFDVMVTENTFGDILTDEASMLAGSMGMLPSASLAGVPREGVNIFGMYEPIHGSAPRRAGLDMANPIAIILSVAMMLRYSFGLAKEAQTVEAAVDQVLNDGYRTYDIMDEGKTKVGTKQMGDLITEKVEG